MNIIQVEKIIQDDPAHARMSHEKKYTDGAAFINGKYCSMSDAAIPIGDHGFFHSDAAYDVTSATKGYIFRLQDHLDRLERSCESLRLQSPYDREGTTEIITSLIKTVGTKEAYIFWCVTRGFGKSRARSVDPDSFENRFYAFVLPLSYNNIIGGDGQRTRGMDIMISRDYIRIPPNSVSPLAKNFHWLDMQMSLFEAGDQGKEWSVLTGADGFLTEAPGANIFIIKSGELFTPDSGCLEGITRRTALELAKMIGMPVHIEKIHPDQLLEADEAFMTSTAGGILPINSVNDRVLGGKMGPGELTTCLHNMYWEKRWQGWLGTPVIYGKAESSI